MVSSYLQATQGLITQIIAEGERNQEEPISPLFAEFLRLFYQYMPLEDLSDYTTLDLFLSAKRCFDFFLDRPRGTSKLRIYSPETKEHGWQSRGTIVEMINDDMPFIVDSITEALSGQGLTIHQVIHPVISVKRDKQGIAKSIQAIQAHEKAEDAESIIQFHISHIGGGASAVRLEEEIKGVLKAIQTAVRDWKAMLTKAEETVKEHITHGKKLENFVKMLPSARAKEDLAEVVDFLQWQISNNFVFLGYAAYDIDPKTDAATLVPDSALGLYSLKEPELKPRTPQEHASLVIAPKLIEITKANKKSVIHRPVHMDFIGVKRFDKKGNIIGEHRFLGLFTSSVYYQSAKSIPLIRKKIHAVQESSGYRFNGHSGKELAAILEALPRDELFQMTESQLFETSMKIVLLEARPRVRLSVRKDSFERFMSCLIYIPRERMSTELRRKMEDILTSVFKGTVSNHYTQMTDSHLARVHIIIKTEPGIVPSYDVEVIEKRLADAARLWIDDLADELTRRMGEKTSGALLWRYGSAFSASYIESFSAEDAYYDIKQMEKVCHSGKAVFDLYESESDESGHFQLKIYNPEQELLLSSIMPVLENMGVEVKDEHTYVATPEGGERAIWIHHLRFSTGQFEKPRLKFIKPVFEDAIAKIWSGDISNDAFNTLILRAGLEWREVVLVRAYSKYLKQTTFNYSQGFIQETLGKYPQLVKFIIELFTIRNDPAFAKNREEAEKAQVELIEGVLSTVTNLAEDRVIRRFMELVLATLRTNYYQHAHDGELKSYISFKFLSAKVPELPLPKPYAEIFVYSPKVEAIHLRGGKVARGGLRWSDRPEDFRTEILGLMKAQMTKNAVIVPVGSKGGFVIKKPPQTGGREALQQEAIECYRTFLRGLLDITDNIIQGEIIPPKNVIRHDEDDPYLVVAADKGTATFSDIANAISEEYNFWLGDAFASGGSVGYDHKKMAITARGAWISVRNHFRALGVDPMTEDFTAIGIGDMAGDVFGNGLLMSEHFRLIAAFNHMHIFIDPTPDSKTSFAERKRLFELPRSSWADYNTALISKGGGIFERKAKTITLNTEIKAALEISEDSLSPDELIRAILRAPVDVLWNGGIGTYIKAEGESNEEVGDKANDTVRVNGKELRVKIVGEGGNLGLTQCGRIEYARNGGLLNTDAMDNSGGVDCSDHEVNIKIALDEAVRKRKLSGVDRNVLLEEMTDEVAQLVLRDNRLQNQAVNIAIQQGGALLESQARLIESLEKTGLLNRKIEFLPAQEELNRLHTEGKGLTRPELCVLLAYSKIALYEELVRSNLPDDPYYQADLEAYFPVRLRQNYVSEIAAHPLKREIIATAITNSMVNRTGSTFFSRIMEDTGMIASDIARAYTVVREIFHLRDIWAEIEALQSNIKSEIQSELYISVNTVLEHGTLWFLRHGVHPLNITQTIKDYGEGIEDLSKNLEQTLSGGIQQRFETLIANFEKKGIPASLAQKVASLQILAAGCDIVHVARQKHLPVLVIAEMYFALGERLHLDWMRAMLAKISAQNHWQRLSIKTVTERLWDQQMRLSAGAVAHFCEGVSCSVALNRWNEANSRKLQRFDSFISDFKANDVPDFSMMVVAARRLEEL